jgi:hypothetical protein
MFEEIHERPILVFEWHPPVPLDKSGFASKLFQMNTNFPIKHQNIHVVPNGPNENIRNNIKLQVSFATQPFGS